MQGASTIKRTKIGLGFTLLELLLVIMLLGIIAASGGQLLSESFRSAFTAVDIHEVDRQMSLTLDRMAKEIRRARAAKASDLTVSPATEITFTDVDNKNIHYALSGQNLMRTENGGNAQILANKASSLMFSYQDAAGNSVVSASEVKCITITLSISHNDVIRSVTRTLYPRNFIQ